MITNRDLENRVIDTSNDHVPIKFRPTRALLPRAPSAPAGTPVAFTPPLTPALGTNPSGHNGIPLQLLTLLATQTPVKQQSYTNSNITISFTSDPTDKNFYAVDVWFVGYHGNLNPQLMSSGNTSPLNFVCDSTGETVSVFAQTVSSNGMSAPLVFASNCTVTLSGTVNAPPPPSIFQTLVNTPTGYQFTFNFITGLLTDVIANYRIYRNTSNSFSTATVIRTVPQDTHGTSSTFVVQDVIGSQNTTTYYYWVSAVNTSGLESGLTAAQAGAIIQAGWLIPAQYSSATVTLENSNFEASTVLTNGAPPGWTANVATLSYDTVTPFAGTQSLKVVAGVVGGGAVAAKRWSCAAGDQFFISCPMKSDGTSQPQALIVFLNTVGTVVGSVGPSHGTGAAWTTDTASGVAPAGAVSFFFTCDNAVTGGVAYFDNCVVDKIINMGTNTVDGTARFAQTASGLTYRPLTNPVTATDAGSNATITIAAFTMRTSSKGDISINSGTVTALTYSKLYYVYYDDPALLGGAVTYAATLVKETALNGSGRLFVGSVVTPAATAPASIGNSDGGVGAQFGGGQTFLGGSGTTVTTTNLALTGLVSSFYDGSLTTFFTIKSSTTSGASSAFYTFQGMSPTFAPWTGLTLNIRTAVPLNPSLCSVTVDYSLNAGFTFTTLYTVSATTRALTTDVIALPTSQNLAQIIVRVSLSRSSGTAIVELDLYEFWANGVL